METSSVLALLVVGALAVYVHEHAKHQSLFKQPDANGKMKVVISDGIPPENLRNRPKDVYRPQTTIIPSKFKYYSGIHPITSRY